MIDTLDPPVAVMMVGLDGYPEKIAFRPTEQRAHVFADGLRPVRQAVPSRIAVALGRHCSSGRALQ
jgi:hypothetical protein